MYLVIFVRKMHFQFGQKNPLIWTNTFCVQPVGVFINQLQHLHLRPLFTIWTNTFYILDEYVLQFLQYTFVFTVGVFTICAMQLVRAGEAEAATKAVLPRPLFITGNYGHLMGRKGHL